MTLPLFYCSGIISHMPRFARTVFSEIPHHITQLGNCREEVFFTKEDRLIYLEYLEQYCQK